MADNGLEDRRDEVGHEEVQDLGRDQRCRRRTGIWEQRGSKYLEKLHCPPQRLANVTRLRPPALLPGGSAPHVLPMTLHAAQTLPVRSDRVSPPAQLARPECFQPRKRSYHGCSLRFAPCDAQSGRPHEEAAKPASGLAGLLSFGQFHTPYLCDGDTDPIRRCVASAICP